MNNFWSDLIGTSKDVFKLKKGKFSIDASNALTNRTLTLPDANIDFVTASLNQVLAKTSATTFGFVTPTGGGSGFTTIANGGNISGNYDGIVYCAGNANIIGNTSIRGTLIAEGTITITGNYSIEIEHDLVAKGAIWCDVTGTLSPDFLIVHGNCSLGYTQVAETIGTITPGDQDYLIDNTYPLADTIWSINSDSDFFGTTDFTPIAAYIDEINWTSGANAGTTSIVTSATWMGSSMEYLLASPTPNPITPTDTFTLNNKKIIFSTGYGTLAKYAFIAGANAGQIRTSVFDDATYLVFASNFPNPLYDGVTPRQIYINPTQRFRINEIYNRNLFPVNSKVLVSATQYFILNNTIQNPSLNQTRLDLNTDTGVILTNSSLQAYRERSVKVNYTTGLPGNWPSITIKGNFHHEGDVMLSPTSGSLNGCGLNVGGDITTKNISNVIAGTQTDKVPTIDLSGSGIGHSGALIVGGDIINTSVRANGGWRSPSETSTSSGNGGDISCANFIADNRGNNYDGTGIYLESRGGEGPSTVTTYSFGNGGSVIISGNLTCMDFDNSGGAYDYNYSTTNTINGGNGGTVQIGGNVVCYNLFNASGGAGWSTTSAANSGRTNTTFIIWGSLYAGWISFTSGSLPYYLGDNLAHTGLNGSINSNGGAVGKGNGNYAEQPLVKILGDIICQNDLNFAGSTGLQTFGNFPRPGSYIQANNIYCKGYMNGYAGSGGYAGGGRIFCNNLVANRIYLQGSSATAASTSGGQGGPLTVKNILLADYVYSQGGSSTLYISGNGGSIFAQIAYITGQVNISSNTGAVGGNGGNYNGSILIANFNAVGGVIANGGAGTSTFGGNGGSISPSDETSVYQIQATGGQGPTKGGNGGFFSTKKLYINENAGGGVRLFGGDATTNGPGGNGGTITCYDTANCSLIDTYGGNAASAGNGGVGGAMTFYGTFTTNTGTLNSSGGNAFNGGGGAAGNITFYAYARTGSITAKGGNGVSATLDAGKGGDLNFLGKIISPIGTINNSGGNYTGGGSGKAGNIGTINFAAGCEINNLTANHGTGTAPVTTKFISFAGYCIMNTWNITNSALIRLAGYQSAGSGVTLLPAVVICLTRTGKTTMYKSGGTETATSTNTMMYNGTDWNDLTKTVIA